MPLILRPRSAIRQPLDAAAFSPEVLAGQDLRQIGKRKLALGSALAEVGELFEVGGESGDDRLVLEGDLRSAWGIGRGMTRGTITIRGDVGAELGAEMSGGTIEVTGRVGDWAGAGMRGGLLRIRGDAGDSLGAAYPGERLGMREGVILVEGDAGEDAGLAMRRGLIAVAGKVGGGLGRGLVAGSILAFGAVGRHPGAGMKRGTLALLGLADRDDPGLLPTFAPSGSWRPPYLNLYLTQLRRWGFPVPEGTFQCALGRYNGDLAATGRGEILTGSCPSPLGAPA